MEAVNLDGNHLKGSHFGLSLLSLSLLLAATAFVLIFCSYNILFVVVVAIISQVVGVRCSVNIYIRVSYGTPCTYSSNAASRALYLGASFS